MTSSLKLFLILYYIKQIDSKLTCVCSVVDHRGHQNVVRTSVTHLAMPHVPLFCSDHILTSFVIYYWTDTWQLGIYLIIIFDNSYLHNTLNRPQHTCVWVNSTFLFFSALTFSTFVKMKTSLTIFQLLHPPQKNNTCMHSMPMFYSWVNQASNVLIATGCRSSQLFIWLQCLHPRSRSLCTCDNYLIVTLFNFSI